MSMLNRPANGTDLGEVIASTRDYEAAQKTVSKLIAGDVPARHIAIVGEGVRTVERVTGRLGYAVAARSGAINGVLIGLMLSAIMLFGNPEAPISLFLGFILVGVAIGMIMSLITYAIVRRRRDFASVSQMLADHYEVRVQAGSLAKARQVVGAERPVSPRPAIDLTQPPQYGERIPPGGGQPPAAPPVPPTPATPPAGDAPVPPSGATPGASAGDAPTPPAGDAPTPPAGETPAPPAGATPGASVGDAPVPPAGDAPTPPSAATPGAPAPGTPEIAGPAEALGVNGASGPVTDGR